MRSPNPGLERLIKTRTLELLMSKEPEEIGMRDIACACGVSATTIYYYYTDKERLFDAVKRDCLAEMDLYIRDKVLNCKEITGRLRAGIIAFRDWAFENPRVALLVMGRFKPNVTANSEEMAEYYRSSMFAKDLLDQAVTEGLSNSKDTLLDSAVCIAGIWGAIEAILVNRTPPEFWERGKYFTDRMIDMCCFALLQEGEKK